jgi:hypothetical protein
MKKYINSIKSNSSTKMIFTFEFVEFGVLFIGCSLKGTVYVHVMGNSQIAVDLTFSCFSAVLSEVHLQWTDMCEPNCYCFVSSSLVVLLLCPHWSPNTIPFSTAWNSKLEEILTTQIITQIKVKVCIVQHYSLAYYGNNGIRILNLLTSSKQLNSSLNMHCHSNLTDFLQCS